MGVHSARTREPAAPSSPARIWVYCDELQRSGTESARRQLLHVQLLSTTLPGLGLQTIQNHRRDSISYARCAFVHLLIMAFCLILLPGKSVSPLASLKPSQQWSIYNIVLHIISTIHLAEWESSSHKFW